MTTVSTSWCVTCCGGGFATTVSALGALGTLVVGFFFFFEREVVDDEDVDFGISLYA